MRSGDEMTGSVGERAAKSSQGCRKGAMRGKITALEEAYEEYRITWQAHDNIDYRATVSTGLIY